MITPACVESMTKLRFSPWRVRVWRTEVSVEDYYHNDDLEAAVLEMAAIKAKHRQEVRVSDLAKCLLSLDRVNAVEVVDEKGNGIVLYREWP